MIQAAGSTFALSSHLLAVQQAAGLGGNEPRRLMSGDGPGDRFFSPPPSGRSGDGAGNIPQVRGKILIVDDDVYLRRTLVRSLRMYLSLTPAEIGDFVVECDSATAALAVYEGSPQDIVAIISDNDMPASISGITFHKTLRQKGYQVPFVLQSGRITEEDEEARAIVSDPRASIFPKPWDTQAMFTWVLLQTFASAS